MTKNQFGVNIKRFRIDKDNARNYSNQIISPFYIFLKRKEVIVHESSYISIQNNNAELH